MKRLTLKQKKPEQKIIRTLKKEAYIQTNDPYNFELLTDNRYTEEKFSRIDKYWVNHYYLIGTEWLYETIFYPSHFGIELIEGEKKHSLISMLKKLRTTGVGLIGNRPVPKINKPVKRITLKCKPKRISLSCKE